MTRAMSSYWWVFLLRGVLAVIFGVIALLFPGMALTSLVLVFGAYALIDGISAIVLSIGARRSDTQWWMHLLEGVVGVIAGVIALIYPSIAALTLLYVIAAWAIVTGVIEIILAFRLRREITNEFWLGLGGLLSIAFGVYTLIFPGAGALALITLIAIYAIIFGVTFILLAFRLRSHTPDYPDRERLAASDLIRNLDVLPRGYGSTATHSISTRAPSGKLKPPTVVRAG